MNATATGAGTPTDPLAERIDSIGARETFRREAGAVRIATVLGVLGAAAGAGELVLDDPLAGVAFLVSPAAAVGVWLAVAAARTRVRGGLARHFAATVHPTLVVLVATAADMETGGGRGVADLVWTLAAMLLAGAIAAWHRERRAPGAPAPALRRVTVLGIALVAAGEFLIQHLPRAVEAPNDAWWGFDLDSAFVSLALSIPALALAADAIGDARRGRATPWRTVVGLAVIWGWSFGFTDTGAANLLVPAIGTAIAAFLIPVFVPGPNIGGSIEGGPVGAGAVFAATAWAAAVVSPGILPAWLDAPHGVTSTIRTAGAAIGLYQVRDLALFALIARAAPQGRGAGPLWLVWLAGAWIVGPALAIEWGAHPAVAAVWGVPWGALGDNTDPVTFAAWLAQGAGAGCVVAVAGLALARIRRRGQARSEDLVPRPPYKAPHTPVTASKDPDPLPEGAKPGEEHVRAL